MKNSIANKFTYLVLIACLTYAKYNYAAGCGGGSVSGATPPSASATAALDLLKNPPKEDKKEPSDKPPVEPQKPAVATPVPSAVTPPPITPIVAAKAPPMAGKVVWVKGTLKVVGADKKVRVLQQGSPIYPEDSIVTDGKSQAQVVFTDDSIVTVNKSTVFNVTKYDYQPESKTASVGKYVMNLIEGSFRTITGKIPKHNPADYQVNTPIAAIGVRGTGYAAAFGSACRVDVKYFTGTPVLETAKGTLVLTKTSPFAAVTGPNMAPIKVKVEPAVFKNTLPIIPATVASLPTMTEINAKLNDELKTQGGGGVCKPGSGPGGGISIKLR